MIADIVLTTIFIKEWCQINIWRKINFVADSIMSIGYILNIIKINQYIPEAFETGNSILVQLRINRNRWKTDFNQLTQILFIDLSKSIYDIIEENFFYNLSSFYQIIKEFAEKSLYFLIDQFA